MKGESFLAYRPSFIIIVGHSSFIAHRRLIQPCCSMTNIREILLGLAACEDELRAGRFLSPCVGGTLHVRGRGLLYTFTPEPKDFEGWGIFEPLDAETAILVEEAGPAQI